MTTTSASAAERVTALAAMFEPGSAWQQALAAELAAADSGAARLVADGLRRVAAHLAPRPARLVIGGRFSSGKSSVVNLLIGTPLLPTSDYPETGVPCVLTSGAADQVVVQTGNGSKKIKFTTEAIARYVTATGDDGALRESIRHVREVRITVGRPVIPSGAVWVDCPGIDDGMGEGDRNQRLAVELAQAADVLIWVTPAGATFGETEADFVRARCAEAGPASTAFVINKRLDADTEQQWQAALARQRSYASLITKKLDPDSASPRIAFVSARAAAEADRDSFGGPEVRALFAGLSDPAAPPVTATRLFRALTQLRDLMTQLDVRMAAEEQRVAAENATIDATRRERAVQHEKFKRAVRAPVAARLSKHSDQPAAAARYAEKRLMRGSTVKESASHYGALFDRRLGRAADRMAARAIREVNKVARAHHHTSLGAQGQEAVRRALRPGRAHVAGFIPDGDRGLLRRFGDWLNSEQRKRDAIKSQLDSAAREASARILGAADTIVDAAGRYCALTVPEPPSANLSGLNGLSAARQMLERDAAEPLRQALAAALAQAGG